MVFIQPCYSSTHGIYPWYCKWHPLMVFIHPWYWTSTHGIHSPIVFSHGIVTSTHGIHSPMELTRGIVTSTHGIHSPMELTRGIVTEKYYK